MEVGVSLGSNLGGRLEYLMQARRWLAALPGVSVLAASPVYETEPVGVPESYAAMPFLNAVLILETTREIHALAADLRALERRAGRAHGAERNSPRPLDLDILYAGGQVVDESDLQIPHPRWAARRFVVQPLADVRPTLVLPGQTQSASQILLSLPREPAVVLFRKEWQQ